MKETTHEWKNRIICKKEKRKGSRLGQRRNGPEAGRKEGKRTSPKGRHRSDCIEKWTDNRRFGRTRGTSMKLEVLEVLRFWGQLI